MKNIVNEIFKTIFPIFNAYICFFGFVGIYLYAGGSLSDDVGFLIIPVFISLVYGAYVGYLAVRNL